MFYGFGHVLEIGLTMHLHTVTLTQDIGGGTHTHKTRGHMYRMPQCAAPHRTAHKHTHILRLSIQAFFNYGCQRNATCECHFNYLHQIHVSNSKSVYSTMCLTLLYIFVVFARMVGIGPPAHTHLSIQRPTEPRAYAAGISSFLCAKCVSFPSPLNMRGHGPYWMFTCRIHTVHRTCVRRAHSIVNAFQSATAIQWHPLANSQCADRRRKKKLNQSARSIHVWTLSRPFYFLLLFRSPILVSAALADWRPNIIYLLVDVAAATLAGAHKSQQANNIRKQSNKCVVEVYFVSLFCNLERELGKEIVGHANRTCHCK